MRAAGATIKLAVIALVLLGCSPPSPAPAEPPSIEPSAAPAPAEPPSIEPSAAPAGVQPRLAPEPVQLADDLVADERAVRDPATPADARIAAARRQQAAYRAIARHPEWDTVARERIPAGLLEAHDRNVDALRQLFAMTPPRDMLPAWQIRPPAGADELLGFYREAEAATGTSWSHLAAINLIETRLGRIVGDSTAGARGPMQFLPSTFAAYGEGGDIHAPRDAIMAAGRYLAANGFGSDPDRAIFAYNHDTRYVRAVNDFAAVLAADPGSFAGYHQWEVYCATTAGDVLLPIGYVATAPVPVGEYLATHPQ